MDELAAVLQAQDGVVSRRQLLAGCGLDRTAAARLVRRRDLVEVHRGVYVDHTGPLTWQQRAWAAVLWAWPAALAGESALRAYEGPGRRTRETRSVSVVVDRARRLTPPAGIDVRRQADLDAVVRWNLGPPRVGYEHAVIDVASRATDSLALVARLSEASGSRRTTASRLRAVVDEHAWLPHRRLLEAVLDDVAAGACSVLEREYLVRVERAHALPTGRRQVLARNAGRTMWQDVAYAAWGLVVELDGRFDHVVLLDRDRDLERDLAGAVEGRQTVRLGYGQVMGRPCVTARAVGGVLAARGWGGQVGRCAQCGAPDQPG